MLDPFSDYRACCLNPFLSSVAKVSRRFRSTDLNLRETLTTELAVKAKVPFYIIICTSYAILRWPFCAQPGANIAR